MIRADQIAAPEVELRKPARFSGAFFWLSAFYVVYCARPEDWIPGLAYLPLAKISGILALLGLLSMGGVQRRFRDLPRESKYLLALIGVLFVSAAFSPIWRGGAVNHTLDFAKVYIVYLLTFLLVTDSGRLRRIIYIQTISVVIISVVSVVRGYSRPRLEGVIGGIYSNPNDLAFAIVLTLPFCLVFLLTARKALVKMFWASAILAMGLTLFMTASRAGFITLMVSGTVCLWHFGVKGRRYYLIAISGLAVLVLLAVAGGPLISRLTAISGKADTQLGATAYDSYEARKYLMAKSVEGIQNHPILGLGVGNFQVFSTSWHDVHMTYLQLAVEGGIPALFLYLMFFGCGFSNLRKLFRRRDLDIETQLLVGGLHASMIGFVIGALFAPEAYQFFPYFSVAYTSALLAMFKDRPLPVNNPKDGKDWRTRSVMVRASRTKSGDFSLIR